MTDILVKGAKSSYVKNSVGVPFGFIYSLGTRHCEGISHGKLRAILDALQYKVCKELKLYLQLKPPHTGNAYVTEGKITLRYKSKRICPGKNWLLFNIFSLFTKPFLTSRVVLSIILPF